MGIQLISISHKTAPPSVLGHFSFDREGQLRVLHRLAQCPKIQEAVFLSTCNRTELYCGSVSDREVFSEMEEILFQEAAVEEQEELLDYCFRFQGEGALQHLFRVAAGLDSVVLGEDQILGQVKEAYFLAQEQGLCQKEFHSLFRLVITAAKKVKTNTPLSKTSVSTASLALAQAKKDLGSLEGKNILVLGASGKIGGIVVKDALDYPGTHLFVTVRQGLPHDLRSRRGSLREIPYGERYQCMDNMDVIVSATASPHYTITKKHYLEHCQSERERILIDLALPRDMEESLGELPGVNYYSLEDMEILARENNALKQSYIPAAEQILREYQETFEKEQLFGQNREMLSKLTHTLTAECERKPVEQMLEHFFFEIKDQGSLEDYRHFLEVADHIASKNT